LQAERLLVIVLDTDILSIVQRGQGEAYDRLAERLDAAGEPVYTTIISYEEQMRGWLSLIARSNTLEQQRDAFARLHSLLEDFQGWPLLDFDDGAVTTYRRLAKSRLRIGTMDLKIAAIALTHDATLISRNLVDFQKVPGLRTEDWTILDAED